MTWARFASPIAKTRSQIDEKNVFPLDDDNSASGKHDLEVVSKPPVEDGKRSERAKRPRKRKPHTGDIAGPSQIDRGTTNASPTEDKTHSPWVDSLEHMSSAVIERVNIGVKQTLEAATSILTPSAHKKSSSPEPSERPSGLAPPSAAPPPSDFYIPRAPKPDAQEDNKKQGREKARLEKKARREAKRKARQKKKQDRREKRREIKERRRKEKEWKRVAKKGGELPAQLRQGLRFAPDSKIPYNPRCDICKTTSTATTSSQKRSQKCTTCEKQAERESTNQYLKSSKVNLGALPSVENLTSIIEKLLGKGGKAVEGGSDGDQAHIDEELAHHISLHVQDFVASGGEANLCGHQCNNEGQPGHLGHHGLDRNRDSPTATDGGQMVSIPYRNSELLTMQMPTEVDWWAQALSSEMPPPSPYRSSSTPFAVPLIPRSKTTVYEPKRGNYSIPNRFDAGSAAYHFYLPLPLCHSYCCPPGHANGLENWHVPSFPRSAPALSPGYCFDQEALVSMSGWTGTLASDGSRSFQDALGAWGYIPVGGYIEIGAVIVVVRMLDSCF
ncbi:hypothetical protein O1611_g10215 [Lasiodiplodia mahajangana]|uniref:Uncharacterized protein n=1 Tax=Lasiodiplodia mahajangana TaxID=1108764 RepID=A0ACC2J107_9PEZI|nr:hypothetical protein O1611_g10215 [Lasiodiplodia mahajangana]